MRTGLSITRTAGLAALLVTATMFSGAVAVGWPIVAADAISLEARWRINQLQEGRSKFDMAQWDRSHEKLKRALQYTPENAMLHDYMASLYLIRGKSVWADVAARSVYLQDAQRHYAISLKLRPVSGRTWAAMASTQAALGAADEDLFLACRNANTYSPHDPAVRSQILRVVLSRWAVAPDDLKQWAAAIYADAGQHRALRMTDMMKTFNLTPIDLTKP